MPVCCALFGERCRLCSRQVFRPLRGFLRSSRADIDRDAVADSASVQDWRIATNPYSFVDAVTQVLGELAENIPVNLRSGFRYVNRQSHPLCISRWYAG